MNAADKLLIKRGFDLQGNIARPKPKQKKKKPAAQPASKPLSQEAMLRAANKINSRASSTPSEGEAIIAKFLSNNNIEYQREHFGPLLYNPETQQLLFVDFYLPKYNLVIEYDGAHHYRPLRGKEELAKQRNRDKIKNAFCRRQGIRMLRIRGFEKIEAAICKEIDEIEGI